MIYDAATMPLPLHIRADLCVVGSGAGGSMVAMVAAEAGLNVVVLETGGFVSPADMSQREEEMMPRLLVANGGQATLDMGVKIHQGRALGGSTVHNLNLCKRIPAPILADWRARRGLRHLPPERFDALYDAVETLLGVSAVPQARWNRHNQLLLKGVRRLGWEGGGLSHNRSGCVGSGFCEVGCVYDAKNNAAKVAIPRAIDAGATVLTHCAAVVVQHRGGEVRGVEAVAMDPITRRPIGRVQIDAPRVCVSASATGTPALLLRSDVPDPGGETGQTLRVHPALIAAGVFDTPVHAWKGIPQTVECTEFLELERAHPPVTAGRAARTAARGVGLRTWIVPAFAHPMATATMMPGIGAEHRAAMGLYPNLACFTGMIHDLTVGSVRPIGDTDWAVNYWPDAGDQRELAFGLWACARLLQAAGAKQIIVPGQEPLRFSPSDDIAPLKSIALSPGSMDITAVHPMGSVPMGDDPAVAAVGSDGRHHHLDGLWVADGSLFPTSIGGPPQLSIYALGLHVGEMLVG